MKKRVFYHEFTDSSTAQVVDYLSGKHSWQPVLMSGHDAESMRPWVNSNHSNCILQDTLELRQGIFNYGKIGPPVPIDARIINSFAKYEMNFLANFPDPTGWNYSFEERKQFYYSIIRYWNTALHHLKPDLLVFFTWPHTATCHSLYLLGKYYYNIDILFLDAVPFFDRDYRVIGSSMEELYFPFIRTYRSKKKITAGPDVVRYLAEIRSKQGKTPEHIREVYTQEKHITLKQEFKSFLELLSATLKNGTGFKKMKVDWKKNQKPFYSERSRMNHFDFFFFSALLRRKNRKLTSVYKGFCSQPDFTRKYIYFAAPYQPEAVTLINGGRYEDLFLVLDILSSVCPKDWVIYYKEHPATFLESFHGSLKRDSAFYEHVNSYGNILIIPQYTDSFVLIDNSQAVATAAGTVAWESAARGKPAISFGGAWYQGCKSIFTIDTVLDAEVAIKKILQGYKPDQKDIERYAAAIESIAFKGMLHPEFANSAKKDRSPEFHMERIGMALHQAHQRLY